MRGTIGEIHVTLLSYNVLEMLSFGVNHIRSMVYKQHEGVPH